jgi:hypothetical protein
VSTTPKHDGNISPAALDRLAAHAAKANVMVDKEMVFPGTASGDSFPNRLLYHPAVLPAQVRTTSVWILLHSGAYPEVHAPHPVFILVARKVDLSAIGAELLNWMGGVFWVTRGGNRENYCVKLMLQDLITEWGRIR